MSKTEMLSMLKFGADRIFANEEGEAPTDQELAAIIDRSVTLGQSGATETTDIHISVCSDVALETQPCLLLQ